MTSNYPQVLLNLGMFLHLVAMYVGSSMMLAYHRFEERHGHTGISHCGQKKNLAANQTTPPWQ